MASNIKINVNDINEAIEKLNLIHSEIVKTKNRIGKLPFQGNCSSKGHSATNMTTLTKSGLESLCNNLECMITSTIEVLNSSKDEFISKDEAIAKGLYSK